MHKEGDFLEGQYCTRTISVAIKGTCEQQLRQFEGSHNSLTKTNHCRLPGHKTGVLIIILDVNC